MYLNPYRTRGCPVPYPQYQRIFNGLTGQKNPENDTEDDTNYRRYRHTSGNGRKERTHAKNEQETAAGMVFFPAASKVGNTTCDRITYNDLCRGCTHSCKQSFRAVIILCPATTPNAGKRRTGTMADNRRVLLPQAERELFDSDSIVLLEDMKDGILYSNILLKLYLKSLKNGGKLQLDEHIPYTAQMIATLTRHQIGTVERALEIFRQLGLVEQLDRRAFI